MLNFISSPIGNLNDISLRSINVLKNSDYIFSEDTRVSSKLLNFAKINKKPISFHEHNEKTVTKRIISLLPINPYENQHSELKIFFSIMKILFCLLFLA